MKVNQTLAIYWKIYEELYENTEILVNPMNPTSLIQGIQSHQDTINEGLQNMTDDNV